MENKKCKKCGEYMSYGLYPYHNQEWDEINAVEKMPGYKCFDCGYEEFEQDIINGIDKEVNLQKMLYKRKKGIESPIQPIMISKVKDARVAKEIQPRLMADVLGVSEQRYGSIERNNNTPNVFLALQLSKIMGVDIHDLYEIVYIPTPLYNKLKVLNDKFEIIEGIPELLDRNANIDVEIKMLQKELAKRRAEVKKIVSDRISSEKVNEPNISYTQKQVRDIQNTAINNDETNNKIKNKIEDLRKEKIEINEKVRILTGKEKDDEGKSGKKNPKQGELEKQDFLLRLGYCIDSENWDKVKDMYKDELVELDYMFLDKE